MGTFWDYVMQFIRQGIGVIPVQYREKRPDGRLLPEDANGDITWEPFKTEIPSEDLLRFWFGRGNHNYGVVAGWQGLVVLDFDDMQEYHRWRFWASRAGSLAAWVAQTAFQVASSRGMHVYIRLPHHEKNRKLGKLDVKGNGYVLGPGSIHPSGAIYTAMRETFAIPMVQALSDVLPAALLAPPPHTQQSPAATASAWAQPGPAAAMNARLQGSLVKKIKGSVAIESLFPGAQSTGPDWLLTQCPLHDDHNPSFWINTRQQICGCFAGCNDKPMDVINLYARMNGLNNSDAIAALGQNV